MDEEAQDRIIRVVGIAVVADVIERPSPRLKGGEVGLHICGYCPSLTGGRGWTEAFAADDIVLSDSTAKSAGRSAAGDDGRHEVSRSRFGVESMDRDAGFQRRG